MHKNKIWEVSIRAHAKQRYDTIQEYDNRRVSKKNNTNRGKKNRKSLVRSGTKIYAADRKRVANGCPPPSSAKQKGSKVLAFESDIKIVNVRYQFLQIIIFECFTVVFIRFITIINIYIKNKIWVVSIRAHAKQRYNTIQEYDNRNTVG